MSETIEAMALHDFIKQLREDKYYYREGDPYAYTALERGVRCLVADDLENLLVPFINRRRS